MRFFPHRYKDIWTRAPERSLVGVERWGWDYVKTLLLIPQPHDQDWGEGETELGEHFIQVFLIYFRCYMAMLKRF